ncbi:MAG: excinuclease ABC subunit UvrC [Rickettsiales bacterium]|nr:excinuclease ABC subunit UvrC [Rickettsiales bacterium]
MPAESIKTQLAAIPQNPGVYQFFDAKEQILYVGKAKNLHKRVSSYTKPNQLSNRIARMVFLAQKIEIIQTENEVEALLLEHNLIKKLSPRFNILLRDDKTFPQILITDHKFPQITKHRGQKNTKGSHFGPFASAHDVKHTIDVLRKIFLLRNCSDDEFKSRKKPCLEFQIKRCLAPCVAMVSEDDYQIAVKNTIEFLSGKSVEVQKELTAKMQQLSAAQNYEKAAFVRDQIKSLDAIQTKQNINVDGIDNADVITVVTTNGAVCAYVGFFRGGQSLGSKPYFYEIENGKKLEEFLAEFLGQFYLAQIAPSLVLLNLELEEKNLMEEFLAKISDKKTEILTPKRGARLALIKDQERLALQNLEQKILQNLNNKELLFEVKKLFDLPKMPQRIEVYDNSHTQGTNAVGALITAGVDGFIKSGYRKFNIRFEGSGGNRDDTAMMREVLMRRFSKLEKAEYPDLIIIDGGKGQLSAAQEVFAELKLKIPLVCMSKGENRNAGEEWFHQFDSDPFTLPKHHPVMHYLQRLRDEAHRFAIMTHRKKRGKAALE